MLHRQLESIYSLASTLQGHSLLALSTRKETQILHTINTYKLLSNKLRKEILYSWHHLKKNNKIIE